MDTQLYNLKIVGLILLFLLIPGSCMAAINEDNSKLKDLRNNSSYNDNATIYVIENFEPFDEPDFLQEWLFNSSYNVKTVNLYNSDKLMDMKDIGLLIIKGGPMNVDEEEKYPWLVSEKSFIRKTISNGTPVLGICLGAELITEILGGSVTKAKTSEHGWYNISRSEDVLLESKIQKSNLSLPDSMKVFEWHDDTFSIPQGATLLYLSDTCKNEAYIYNDRVIALQFHPEMDESSVREVLSFEAKESTQNGSILLNNSLVSTTENCSSVNKFLEGVLYYLLYQDNDIRK